MLYTYAHIDIYIDNSYIHVYGHFFFSLENEKLSHKL